VVSTPNLSIDKFIDSSKTVGTSPYKTNDVIVFGVTVKNTGNVNLTNIRVTDTLPEYTDFDSEKTKALNGGTSNWTCTQSTCTYSPNISLTVNESKTFYFAVKVKSYTTLGDLRSKNKVCANVAGVSEKCDEVPFDIKDIVQTKSIYIDKMIDAGNSIGTSPYKAGDLIAFKIRVQNTGNTALENVILKDTIPPFTAFSASDTNRLNETINVSKAWSCTSSTCEVNLGTLVPTQIVDIFFATKVTTYERYGENVTSENKACVVTTSLTGEKCDTVPFDLKDLIAPVRSISIDKSIEGSVHTYQAGEYVKFKVVVTNTGNTTLDNVIVEDAVPVLTNYDQAKTLEANGGINLWECASRVCKAGLGSMASKASRTLYYVVKVQNYTLYGDDVKSENTACVTASMITGKKCDTVPFDLKDLIEPVRSIAIVKYIEGSNTGYKAGDFIKFRVVVTNTGNTRLENVVVEDNVPQYTDYDKDRTVQANGGNDIWDCTNRNCKASLGSIEAKASKTVYFVVKVQEYAIYDEDVKSSNTACVSASLITLRKCHTVHFDLVDLTKPTKSISIDKSIDGGTSTYKIGDFVKFKIIVSNTGNTSLADVVVEDQVPLYTDFDSNKTAEANGGANIWECTNRVCKSNIGTLPAGASKTLYYVVKVQNYTEYGEDVRSENTACVSAPAIDGKKCDDVDFDLEDQIKLGDSSVSIDKVIDTDKTTASSPYEANAKIVFRITVKNNGETDLTNVVVTDSVPAHTDFDADATNALTNGWSCDGGTCTYTIGNLSKSAEKVLYYVVSVENHNITDEDVKSENTACVKARGENPQNLEQCDEVGFDIKDKEDDDDDKEEGDDVSISKKVRKEGDDRWEDKVTDVEEGDVIEFKIKVENKSDEDTSSIDDLKMEDKLPKELEKVSGGLTEYWDDFDHDDDKTFIIKAKVRSSEYDKDVDKCVDNKARVYIDGDEEDEAEATVCYSNVEVSELPETGAGSLAAISGLITSAFGIVLKKKRV
jgi:uncharacterized repeat protein (TIGR01451 family)